MKYTFLVLALIFSPIYFTHAQVGLSVTDTGLVIDTEPLYPDPNTEVVAKLNDYSVSGQVSVINWKVDGKTIPEAANQRSITFTTKAAGENTVVEAIVTLAAGASLSAKRVIAPMYLDVIIEPQTRTPAFYLGRALPSIGSQINLTALVNGETIPSKDLLYTWKVNNTVTEGGTLRGGNKISIKTPMGRLALLTLEVSKLDGSTVARRNIQIPSIDPLVYFYETSSLYGQSIKPVKKVNLVGASISIQAEPYYLDILTYNSPGHLEWKVDGNKNTKASSNPYEITLAGQNGISGTSRIDFHVRNLEQLLQGGKGDFQINF